MPSHPHPACNCLGHALSSEACDLRLPALAFRIACKDRAHLLDNASPRWADWLFSPSRGASAWSQWTEHFLSDPWVRLPMGITELDTALLTHKTNTCKLFKNISIKLPGWLRAIHPLSGAPSSPDPSPVWEVLKGGQALTPFPGIVQFLGDFEAGSRLPGQDQPLAEHARE